MRLISLTSPGWIKVSSRFCIFQSNIHEISVESVISPETSVDNMIPPLNCNVLSILIHKSRTEKYFPILQL